MRCAWLAVAAVTLAWSMPDRAHAQFGNFYTGDPFSSYYSYYLPYQASQAARPRIGDELNAISAQRQYSNRTDRSVFGDPFEPFSLDALEKELANPARDRRMVRSRDGVTAQTTRYPSVGGSGGGYFNSVNRYFPTHRVGQGANRNMSAVRGGRGRGGGGGGMGGGAGMGGMGGSGGMGGGMGGGS
jgi:hypothetical protein